MNNHRGVTKTLALLDRLKTALRDFAAREEQLENEFRSRSAVENRALDAAAKEKTQEHANRITNVEVEAQNALAHQQATYERRKTRINDVHKLLRRRAGEDVTTHEGRRKHKLQSSAMEAERKRDANLAAAAAAREAFRQQLAESAQIFAVLEAEAAIAFRGYPSFKKLLAHDRQWPEPDVSPGEHELFQELRRLESKARDGLAQFRRLFLPTLFRLLPLWLLLGLLAVLFAASVPTLHQLGQNSLSYRETGIAAGAIFVLLLLLHFIGRRGGANTAKSIAADLAKARRLHDVCYQKADIRLQEEQTRIKTEFANATQAIDLEYKKIIKEAIALRDQRPRQIDEKAHRANQRNEQQHKAGLIQIEERRKRNSIELEAQTANLNNQLTQMRSGSNAKFEKERLLQWQELEAEWKNVTSPICQSLVQINEDALKSFPAWELPSWKNWSPPAQFENAAKFGRLEIDLEKFAVLSKPANPSSPSPNAPASSRVVPLMSGEPQAVTSPSRLLSTLNLPWLPGQVSKTFALPLCLEYPNEGSILFEGGKSGGDDAIASINNIIFRLLATTPPGKLSFTIFDPVGLGQNFAGLMHLADYEDVHINSRIWTQTTQMEEKLGELSEHMEKVIQMYLRNEYETIAQYNAQAGSIAERYHFLVVASFPVNFSDTAVRRLRNLAASGARCGVYTLIFWDQRHSPPQEFVPDELRKNSVRLIRVGNEFQLVAPAPQQSSTTKGKVENANEHLAFACTRLTLDPPPSPEFATHFLHQVGQFSKDSNRVEVPFREIAPSNGEVWSEETTEELTVPIGRSGATKLQYLAIGKGTRQHALIAGKTGSGKSTLFHVIITNLALWCSPDQVEFYLVDFKKGVEFKCYASRRLPHARVVAIESDRQFGLSVLERVDAELRRRGDLFRKLGVQDIPGYKRAGGTEKMPRSLLMIDEFQEFFTEEDRISQSAAVLLDRIVRQGRAFGIHVVLGSQTLGGAYTLARATLGQMVIRIALQCNEADAYLIMDQDNPAPRLLTRPGEGIYNDSAGSIEGNSPFQAVWLPEEVRDSYLAQTRALADKSSLTYPAPFVFEGNAPADVRESPALNALLANQPHRQATSEPARLFLGAPNSIKGPTEAVFVRQSGNNLLVVGQNEESTLAILAVSLVSLATQFRPQDIRMLLLDTAAPGSPQAEFLENVMRSFPHQVQRPKGTAFTEAMSELSEELKRRSTEEHSESGVPTFVFIHGLENFKKLRAEDEFSFSSGGDADSGPSPASVLQSLITEGPSHGIHVIITCDSFNNVSRFLGRKALSEFATRVLFQMSASDSAALIDSPDAGTLGMHRALLYNDREGYTETFRPYSRPGNDWLEEAGKKLKIS